MRSILTPSRQSRDQERTDLTIQAETQLNSAYQFAGLIIATRSSKPVRLRDVAKR